MNLSTTLGMADPATRADIWIEGLDDIQISLDFDLTEIRLQDLAEQLSRYEAVTVRDRKVSGLLGEAPDGAEIHGHLRIRVVEDDEVDILFGIFRGRAAVGDSGLLITTFLGHLDSCLSEEANRLDASAIASFTLSSHRWHSTVPLPITLPGMLDSAAGSPEVAGFEFNFTDDSTPLSRASISLFDGLDEYMVRMMYDLPIAPLHTIIERAIGAAREHARLLVSEITTPSSGKANE